MYKVTKRFLDILLAFLGLIISAPFILLISLTIKLTSKGPVFFTLERLGRSERPFTLIKFRTMIDNAEKGSGPRWASSNDPRVTKIGRFLRMTRLDELPQLINILKGDMTFVGPRPIRKYFADLLKRENVYYQQRFTVKPGLTGWAQVQRGYAASIKGELEKLEYDLFYIQNRSILFDFFILFKTVIIVCTAKGR